VLSHDARRVCAYEWRRRSNKRRTARRAVVPWWEWRRPGGAGRVPDRHCAVCDDSERANAAVSGFVQGASAAVRGQFYGDGLQRTASAGTGLRLRAGDEETGAATEPSVR